MAASRKRTAAQNRAMWGLVHRLARATGGDRDDATEALRACCVEVSGQEHTSQLSEVQARRVIALLEQRLPASSKPAQRQRPQPKPRGRATITPRQQKVLTALFHQVGFTDLARQRTFTQRQCGAPWPQTQRHADQLFEALKAMALRHVSPMDAWRRVQALDGHKGLDAWQRGFITDMRRQFQEAEAAGTLDKVLSPHKLLKLVEAETACGVTP